MDVSLWPAEWRSWSEVETLAQLCERTVGQAEEAAFVAQWPGVSVTAELARVRGAMTLVLCTSG